MKNDAFKILLKLSICLSLIFHGVSWAATDCNQVTEIPVAECQELVNLYNSTDGPNWSSRLGWNVTNTPCKWSQVECLEGHVVSLLLYNNQLSGTIPNFNLPNLESIYLSSNQLSGTIPNFNLPNLESLNLYINQLSGIIPNFNLPNLKELWLHGNQLSGTIPNFNLPNLTWLSLGENQLSGTIPNFNLPNLESLSLDDNQISGTIPNFNLPNLTYLSLFNNQLSGTIPNFNLPNLESLWLSSNKLSGTIPNFNLPNLEKLFLNNNQLSGTIPNFTTIDLSDTDLLFSIYNNCGLIAFDETQKALLDSRDTVWHKWQEVNPDCPATPPPSNTTTTPLYRLWSHAWTAHFYTLNAAERDRILSNPQNWRDEGVAYNVYTESNHPTNAKPVYRFWSYDWNAHLYTINQGEMERLVNNYPDNWRYEGIAYYAYAEGEQPADAIPIYRFYSFGFNAHFYTTSADEQRTLSARPATEWRYEGIAWYAPAIE